MRERSTTRGIYELQSASVAQKIVLAVFVGLWLAIACWLLIGPGFAATDSWFGWSLRLGDSVRCACLAAAFSIYYLRLYFTWFVFLKRAIGWGEVFTIAPWILCIYLFLAVLGGTNPNRFGIAGSAGLVLFAAGSWLNTHAELTRHMWKLRPENRAHLYTQGLFRFTRHPNYLGDLISFSGLCLISGRLLTATVPTLMLAGFVFVNIPMLDAYLHERYGAAFDDYAAKARKLIPFVY